MTKEMLDPWLPIEPHWKTDQTSLIGAYANLYLLLDTGGPYVSFTTQNTYLNRIFMPIVVYII